jgi:hypothetical protein
MTTRIKKTEQVRFDGRIVEKDTKTQLKGNMLRILTPKEDSRTTLYLSRSYRGLFESTLGLKTLKKIGGEHRDQETELPVGVFIKKETLFLKVYHVLTDVELFDKNNSIYNFMIRKTPSHVEFLLKKYYPVEFEHGIRIDLHEDGSREYIPNREPYSCITFGFPLDTAKRVGREQNNAEEWFMSGKVVEEANKGMKAEVSFPPHHPRKHKQESIK